MNVSQRTIRQLPQLAIKAEINQVIHSLYARQWNPRVVRQSRSISAGSLRHIDYAMPCFELATLLKLDVQTVAAEIVAALHERVSSVDAANVLFDAQFEAVGGYVNFCVSDDFLRRSIKSAIKWYISPSLNIRQRPIDEFFLVHGEAPNEGAKSSTQEAHALITQLYTVLGKRHGTTQLLSDYSESMIEKIARCMISRRSVEGAIPVIEKIRIQKEVKKFFARMNRLQPTSNEGLQVEIYDCWQTERQKLAAAMTETAAKTVHESELIDQVHAELNDLTAKAALKRGLQKDGITAAVYYEDTSNVIPLRSAGNSLYSSAYLLMTLQNLVQDIKKSQSKTLVVLAPQKLHYLIHTYVRLNVRSKYAPERVICFDPNTSRAVISALKQQIGHIDDHFTKIAHALILTSKADVGGASHRQAIMALIDLPIDLSRAVTDNKLPITLDLLQQSNEMLHVLTD